MDALVDDVGSFPLPLSVDGKVFERAYALARRALVAGEDMRRDAFLLGNFYGVVVDSFRVKLGAGLDVTNYPQQYDMHRQLGDVLREVMVRGTYLIDKAAAVLPEVHVIKEEARRLCEESGKRIELRVCILGPLEFYLREVGTVAYEDLLLQFAENVNNFARNSILNDKYVRTAVVSLDEPSFGFREILADRGVISGVLEKAFDFSGAVRQVHLHSASRITDVLAVRNVDVVSFEYAASPKNIEGVSRRMLEQADKRIRVGVSRTDVDAILAELYERGIERPVAEQLVEAEAVILKRYRAAREKYGELLTFTGPDCGLGGWPTQESAQLLLKRTVNAVKSARYGM